LNKLYTFVRIGRLVLNICKLIGQKQVMRYRYFFLLLIFLPGFVKSQDYSRHNWYFGNSTQALRFDVRTNAVQRISKQLPQPFGTGGSLTVTDHTNRNLLFYSDGATIYDVTGTEMFNGQALGGSTSENQPVVACPVPGQNNQYYVFIRQASNTVLVSTVNMNIGGTFPAPPTGDVTSRNQPVGTGITNATEAMMVIPADNGTDYWLITQQAGTGSFIVTSVTSLGFTQLPPVNIGISFSASHLAYHAASGRIAVTPTEASENVLILNFNDITGALSLNQILFNTSVAATTQPAYYDVEWSLTGQYLYFSRTGDAGVNANILQLDLDTPSASTQIINTPSFFRSWGLQQAPDSTIYHLYQSVNGGPFLLGQINQIDSAANLVTYRPQLFAGNVNFNATQFSSFAPSREITLTVTFTSQGNCSNANTTFYPTVTPAADSLVWNFNDGSAPVTAWSPVHQFTAGGTFNVQVTAFLSGETATFSAPVIVTQFDLQISLVQDTTACCCELPFPSTIGCTFSCERFEVTASVSGGTPTSTQWYGPAGELAGQTSLTLQPDSAGYYYVVVTDASGCSTHAGVNIREYGVQEQRANFWYFGNRAGIDFNTGAVPVSNTVMNAPEGCAIICDRNGQTIFFTDGNTVWDRDFNVLANTIGGDVASTQSSLIVPVAGDETLYYIFTTQEIFGSGTFEVRYSLYDLKENNGSGAIVQQSVPLFSRSTERITGNQNWVIVHEFGNNRFRAYRVTAQGIENPVISSVGSDHQLTIRENGEGYMKLGPFNRLAVALSTPGTTPANSVEVFDFVDSTGVVTNLRTVNTRQNTGQVYGLEFSPGGNKLYASVTGATSQIVEFAFDSLAIPYFKGVIGTENQTLGAIQLAPNGQIYVAAQNQNTLGIIVPVEDTTQVSVFNPASFGLFSGTSSRLGLPNFIQNLSTPTQGPSIQVDGFCLGSVTSFTGSGTDNIDELTWFFGDGESFIGDTATHIYDAPGDYTVTLRITNRCGLLLELTQDITINAPPDNPTFLPVGVPQPAICSGSLLLEALPLPVPNGYTYAWTTGETTRTIAVTRPLRVGVTITDANGCTSAGSIIVSDTRPQVDLGPDQNICQNTTLPFLDAQNPGSNYSWTVNGGSPSTGQTRQVITTSTGIFTYSVTVTDPITLCTAQDDVIFTVNATPVFTAASIDATGCFTNDGQINLSITNPPSTFSYFITGPVPSSQSDIVVPPTFNQNIVGLTSGSYGVRVLDQLSGCQQASSVGIGTSVISVSATAVGVCDPITMAVTHNLGAQAFSYRVLDAALTILDNGASAVRASPFNTNTIPSGNTYTVELRRTSDNCLGTANLTINQAATLTINGFSTACAPGGLTQVTVDAPGATAFTWTKTSGGANIVPPANLQSVVISTGNIGLTVLVDDGPAGLCPATGIFNATGSAPFTATLVQSDACADIVTLTANPAGNFTYLWTRNPAPDPIGGRNLQLSTADDNANYGITVRDITSGCTSTANITVAVVGELRVALTTTPPCEGNLFTLTATPSQTPDAFEWLFNRNNITGANLLTYNDTRNGVYTFSFSRRTCTAADSIRIISSPLTPGSLNDQYLICNDPANPDPTTKEVLLNAGNGFTSYNWFKNGNPENVTTQTYTATEPGVYAVELINNFGCPSSDETTLLLECEPSIVAPTAFRPSSNVAENSSFFIYSFFVANEGFEVFIFNRWGEMIYQTNERDFRWNGTNKNGVLLPAGTYTYVVKYRSSFKPELGILEKRGGVVLVR
jgi:gliding motility-associated-like protein